MSIRPPPYVRPMWTLFCSVFQILEHTLSALFVIKTCHNRCIPSCNRYSTVTRPLRDRYTTVARPRSGAFRHVLFRVPKKQNMILGVRLPSPVTMPLPHSAQTSLERYSTVERPLRDHFATVTRPFRDFARDAPHSAVSHPNPGGRASSVPLASPWASLPAQKARPPHSSHSDLRLRPHLPRPCPARWWRVRPPRLLLPRP